MVDTLSKRPQVAQYVAIIGTCQVDIEENIKEEAH